MNLPWPINKLDLIAIAFCCVATQLAYSAFHLVYRRKIIHMCFSYTQNDRLYLAIGTRKRDIAADRLSRTRPTFSKSLMVPVGACFFSGSHDNSLIEPGVKINGQSYRDALLMEDLLPEIREFSEFYIFQQDG